MSAKIVKHKKTDRPPKDPYSRYKRENKVIGQHSEEKPPPDKNVKKGNDRNAFLVDREIDRQIEIFTKPKLYFATMNYFNNDAILTCMRNAYRLDTTELVSVIIPTYNRYSSLLVAIESVKTQIYPNIEIIVVNDASTQPEYADLCKRTDIVLISLPTNMRQKYGVMSAQGMTRNEGLKIAKGVWCAFLDDDDAWLPEKIWIQLYFLKKRGLEMCSTNYFRGNGTFEIDKINSYKKGMGIDLDMIARIDKWEYLLISTNFKYSLLSSLVMKKSLFDADKAGLFLLVDAEDYSLMLKCYGLTKMMFIDIMLVYYDLQHAGAKHYKVGYNWAGKQSD